MPSYTVGDRNYTWEVVNVPFEELTIEENEPRPRPENLSSDWVREEVQRALNFETRGMPLEYKQSQDYQLGFAEASKIDPRSSLLLVFNNDGYLVGKAQIAKHPDIMVLSVNRVLHITSLCPEVAPLFHAMGIVTNLFYPRVGRILLGSPEHTTYEAILGIRSLITRIGHTDSSAGSLHLIPSDEPREYDRCIRDLLIVANKRNTRRQLMMDFGVLFNATDLI